MESEVQNTTYESLLHCDNTTPRLTFDGLVTLVRVTDVYDGDTLTGAVDVGDKRYRRIIMRLAGLDTPELRSRDVDERRRAISARNRLLSWLLPSVFCVNGKYTQRMISAALDRAPAIVTAKLGRHDKYGRVLCKLLREAECINDILVNEQYALPYDGRGKKSFDTLNPEIKISDRVDDL
jgi:micrococcal nuclease